MESSIAQWLQQTTNRLQNCRFAPQAKQREEGCCNSSLLLGCARFTVCIRMLFWSWLRGRKESGSKSAKQIAQPVLLELVMIRVELMLVQLNIMHAGGFINGYKWCCPKPSSEMFLCLGEEADDLRVPPPDARKHLETLGNTQSYQAIVDLDDPICRIFRWKWVNSNPHLGASSSTRKYQCQWWWR